MKLESVEWNGIGCSGSGVGMIWDEGVNGGLVYGNGECS